MIANGPRILLVGGGLLLTAWAICVGLLACSSGGSGAQRPTVEETTREPQPDGDSGGEQQTLEETAPRPQFVVESGGERQTEGDAAGERPLVGGCRGEYRGVGSFDYSADGRRLAFQSFARGVVEGDKYLPDSRPPGVGEDETDSEICVADADGTSVTRLTDNTEDEEEPVWSPDGSRVAFVRSFEGFGYDAVVITNADGSGEVELRWEVYVTGLSWSPDGETLAFSDSYAVYAMDVGESTTPTNLTPKNLTPVEGWQRSESPAWSPDGRSLTFASERDTGPATGDAMDIYVLDQVDEGHASRWRQVTDGSAHDVYPAWSPEGTEIVFNSAPPEKVFLGEYTIYRVDADGSNKTRLGPGLYPRWSADGTHIIYLGDGGIFRMAADGSNPTLVFPDNP